MLFKHTNQTCRSHRAQRSWLWARAAVQSGVAINGRVWRIQTTAIYRPVCFELQMPLAVLKFASVFRLPLVIDLIPPDRINSNILANILDSRDVQLLYWVSTWTGVKRRSGIKIKEWNCKGEWTAGLKEFRIGYVWREKKKKREMKYTRVPSSKFKEQKYGKFWVSEILHVNLFRLRDRFSSIVDKEYIFDATKRSQEKWLEDGDIILTILIILKKIYSSHGNSICK